MNIKLIGIKDLDNIILEYLNELNFSEKYNLVVYEISFITNCLFNFSEIGKKKYRGHKFSIKTEYKNGKKKELMKILLER